MWHLECSVVIYAVFIVGFSIYLFMMNSTSQQVGDLISAQNSVSLQLWRDLLYFENHLAKESATDSSLPPGLFEKLVEFSRTNAIISKTVYRLNLRNVFARDPSWDRIREYIKPTDGRRPPIDFDHLGVDPYVNATTVTSQVMYQIELYQALRDYAQDESTFWKGCIGAVSIYVLPLCYALLGAFLYAFRSRCQQLRAGHIDGSPDRSSRFLMAGIAGIAISTFNSFAPKDMLLSPLAIAFVLV
jgi:hypothetical protein